MFAFLVVALIIVLFSSLIVGNNNDIVSRGLSGDEFNKLRFLFV